MMMHVYVILQMYLLYRDCCFLSLNGKEPLDERETLADLSIVSGDLLHVMCDSECCVDSNSCMQPHCSSAGTSPGPSHESVCRNKEYKRSMESRARVLDAQEEKEEKEEDKKHLLPSLLGGGNRGGEKGGGGGGGERERGVGGGERGGGGGGRGRGGREERRENMNQGLSEPHISLRILPSPNVSSPAGIDITNNRIGSHFEEFVQSQCVAAGSMECCAQCCQYGSYGTPHDDVGCRLHAQ